MAPPSTAVDADRPLRVFFDGSCPLCSREISFYRGLDDAGRVDWVDVSPRAGAPAACGLTRERALARFHVQLPDGTLVSGGAAFAELWAVLPRLRLVGRILRRRPFVWGLEAAYALFLRLRPSLQRVLR